MTTDRPNQTVIAAEPFEGVESYYHRLFQQIKGRHHPLGTGGDIDCLIAMVEWLWERYRAEEQPRLQKWIDPKTGEECREQADAIELRSAGAGWRWHDFDGREWDTGSGHNGPVWRRLPRG